MLKPINNNHAISTWIVVLIIFVCVSLLIFAIHRGRDKVKEDELSEAHFPSIRVEIQNGCGFSGVAGNVRAALATKNIDVIQVRNARIFKYDESLIIVKHDDPEDLQRLKRMTGIENVIYAVNDTYLVPFIIVAGRDYQKYFKG